MNLSALFIGRPFATALLMVGLLLCGLVSYPLLPVSPLPDVNYPTISVTAQLPGADPQTMASSVATPLEEQFGQIPDIVQMTSSSTLGYSSITLQFALSRNIDGAAADVLAAIRASALAGQQIISLPLPVPFFPEHNFLPIYGITRRFVGMSVTEIAFFNPSLLTCETEPSAKAKLPAR